MFSRFSFLFIFLLSTVFGSAQITTNPAFPVASGEVTIVFNSAEESRLNLYTGDLYAHTGLITEKSADANDWKYVIESWKNNDTQPKLTHLGNGIYELKISPDLYSYYKSPTNEKILKLAFVFRSADGNKQTNNLYVDVYEGGLKVQITEPSGNLVLQKNTPVHLQAESSAEANLRLILNDQLLTATTGTSISYEQTFTEGGTFHLLAEATAGGSTVYDTLELFVRNEVTELAKPTAYKKGINYIDDQTAALVLYAPNKEYVLVTGDFSDWKLSNEFLMKKDGDTFWTEIGNLEKGKEYRFQYLIDGAIKIADPYSEKILDPANDPWISDATYPGLIDYPAGKTEGIVTVLETGQENYNWQVSNFQMPEKEKMVIYELLIRDFTSEHSYQAVIDKLDYLEDLRINVLELMPVNEFEGNISWGYNPSFYFAPDKYYGPKNKLKELIDACHQRGIAVVIDMVLNHSYNQSPLAQMYWNSTLNRPASDNPWYNETSPNPVFSWGNDFNHESTATQELVDSVNAFWMSEYKVDGFRFDFTKGFTNTVTTDDGSSYDASRIAILKRMSDEIWKRNSDALVILEHFADNSEEKELADNSMMIWGNLNHSYSQAAEGSNGNLNWGIYKDRGWAQPNLVTYMESHDEERLMYECLTSDKSNGDYDISDLSTALDRMELNSVFFLPLPGPKMIWQFGERGYDQSINRCENGTINNDCRTAPKPPYWNYLENSERTDLFHVMAKLNELKQNYDEFSTANITYNLADLVKSYTLQSGNNYVLAIGNFDLQLQSRTVNFPVSGKWYNFFKGDSIEVTQSRTIYLQPGEYRLYSTRKFIEPHVVTNIAEIEKQEAGISVYPNPAHSVLNFSSAEIIEQVEVFSLTGKLVLKDLVPEFQKQINIEKLEPGIYLLRAKINNDIQTKKIVVRE